MRRRDIDKEKRIKDAVIEVMRREGFEGASISKIAKEAGISPATVYIYYESKEQMLSSIYQEYTENAYNFLARQLDCGMDGAALIDEILRAYYGYIRSHYKTFLFMEQCTHSPNICSGEGLNKNCIHTMIEELIGKGVLKDYSCESLATIMFYPVKAISFQNRSEAEALNLLDELIQIIQEAVLKKS